MLIGNSLKLPIFITDIFSSGSMSVTNESHSNQKRNVSMGMGKITLEIQASLFQENNVFNGIEFHT